MTDKITRCKKCKAYIDTALGAYEPARFQGRAGTKDEPRSPGERDDICDACQWGD